MTHTYGALANKSKEELSKIDVAEHQKREE
jgi:hypothetical protein